MADNNNVPVAPEGFQDAAASPSPSSTPAPAPAATSQSAPPPAPEGFTDDVAHQPASLSGVIHTLGTKEGLKAVGEGVLDPVQGFGEGALGTVHGVGEMIRKGANFISTGHTEPAEGGLGNRIVPKVGQASLDAIATPDNFAQKVGYGGETLAEFLLGDEALKGLSLAQRFQAISKISAALEKSPRLMMALKLGTSLGKAATELSPEEVSLLKQYPTMARLVGVGMDALRSGVVQGAQTTVRSGGDVKEGAKQGAEMAGMSGAIGAPLAVAGGLLDKGAQAAKTVRQMSEAAKNAPSQEAITQNAQQMVKGANDLMHQEYEEGVQRLGNWMVGKTIAHEGSPLEQSAKNILEVGKSEEKPFAKEIGDTVPGSAPVKRLVSAMAGAPAEEQKAVTPLEGGLLNSAGEGVQAGEGEAQEPEQKPTYTIDDLVEMRQRLGKRMRDLPFDDPDRKIYSQLIQGVDDTVKKMAEQADNPNVAKKLEQMNTTYRQKVRLFQNKDVQALMKGNLNDVAQRLARGETSVDDIRAVRKTIGAQNMGKLGDQMFSRWIADATTDGKFDPEQLVNKWTKMKPEVRDELFSLDDPKNTPQFRDWFGNSKATQPNGDPKVLYHGTRTPVDFDEFSTSGPPTNDEGEAADNGSGADPTAFIGAHFAEHPNVANMFAEGKGWTSGKVAEAESKGRVMPVYLKAENVKDFGPENNLHDFINEGKISDDSALDHAMQADGIDPDTPEAADWIKKYDNDVQFRKQQNAFIIDHANAFGEMLDGDGIARELADQAKARLKDEGFDGLKYNNQVEGGKAWVAFEPEQVKSAIGNSGAYDKESGSLTDVGKDAAKQGYKQAMQAVGRSAAAKKLVKFGVLTGGAGAVWGPLGALIGFLWNKEGSTGVGQLLNWVANHPYTWNSLAMVNKAANSEAVKGVTKLAQYGAGRAATEARHKVMSAANSALSGGQ